MENLDALLLARIQFAFTVSFHIVFPAITIGLASYLAVLEACLLRTGREVYRDGKFQDDVRGQEVQFDHARGGYWATS